MNIGIFDSGLGGLSILKDIVKLLPAYNYIYLGDNARVPYGNRSPQTIYQFTLQAVKYLFENDCQLIIIACNTASAQALRRIQQEYLPKNYPSRRVLGVIRPTVEYIVEKHYQRVGIIATRATIQSQSYIYELNKLNPTLKTFQSPAPLLVPIIEENKGRGELLKLLLDDYVKPLLDQNIQALLLGCTHYGIIAHHIQKYVRNQVKVINQGPIVAVKLENYLARHLEINNLLEMGGKIELLVTDLNENYQQMCTLFLGNHDMFKPIKLIKL